MSTNFDWAWLPVQDGRSRVRQVYRNDKSIGRVRRWRVEGPGELTREWFTAELMKGVLYKPIEGKHATFKAALKRIVTYGVAH